MNNLKVGDVLICKVQPEFSGFHVCGEYKIQSFIDSVCIVIGDDFKDRWLTELEVIKYFTLKEKSEQVFVRPTIPKLHESFYTTAPDYKVLYEASQVYIEQLHKFINQTK